MGCHQFSPWMPPASTRPWKHTSELWRAISNDQSKDEWNFILYLWDERRASVSNERGFDRPHKSHTSLRNMLLSNSMPPLRPGCEGWRCSLLSRFGTPWFFRNSSQVQKSCFGYKNYQHILQFIFVHDDVIYKQIHNVKYFSITGLFNIINGFILLVVFNTYLNTNFGGLRFAPLSLRQTICWAACRLLASGWHSSHSSFTGTWTNPTTITNVGILNGTYQLHRCYCHLFHGYTSINCWSQILLIAR